PLTVLAGTSYLTCGLCNNRLKVEQTGSARFTRVFASAPPPTSPPSVQDRRLQLENELLCLNTQWERKCKEWFVWARHRPTVTGGTVKVVVSLICVLNMIIFGNWIPALFAFLFGSVGAYEINCALEFVELEKEVQLRRQCINEQLFELDSSTPSSGN
ncbi:MAG: hypothetical protein KDA66_16165, partial [Planctomycetaceae bacterium]|nr:hypothetical protein [Planctomycetaceae bacterium]